MSLNAEFLYDRDSSKDLNLYIFKTTRKAEYLYMYKLDFTRNSLYLKVHRLGTYTIEVLVKTSTYTGPKLLRSLSICTCIN